ncbi:GNAT family N-acetyltransferase [Luteipulveratus mongoliensis]|uniref:GCN5 family acetyltransferase n=1 Tax=Luteipulveratus mongoliensis TaxID=571913 RepID=A0A0K1JDU3_9MICO|nr:GNAT family N-acetyltransferase [Luteipulveratus mongoliensis]AKU14887.1 GCN5 family acetyltransferase [Luteipulveratus mongoliensis]
MSTAEGQLRIVPANEADWSDLEAIFGTSAQPARCWCRRFKLQPGESFGNTPAEVRADHLRQQTACGDPDAPVTSGIVAYLDDEPVGWCAVEPRPEYDGLVRVFRVPWDGRDEDKSDAGIWAITCLLVRRGHRRRGVSRAMAAAAVDFARERGARALEAYPITTTAVIQDELLVGTVPTFANAGLAVVHQPSKRRVVMRIDF